MKRFLKSISRNRFLLGAAFGVLALCIFGVTNPALAQLSTSSLSEVAVGGGLPTVSIGVIIARVIRVFLGTLGIIFTVIVLYAGFIYMTAQGDDTKVKKAKDMMKNGIIGMIICTSAFSITWYILNRLLEAASIGGSTTAITDQYSEPLSGSLGAGIVDSHYPERYAIDIPRNTRVMITFKEAINPASIISGYDASSLSTDLNVDNVLFYPTETGESAALTAAEVSVTMNDDDHTIFVFDPVPLLGNETTDTNYTIMLGNGIELESGGAAFSGSYSGGYSWWFEVSTEVDLTPPQVVSVVPRPDADEARNITVSITFNEAMDPVASTGTYVEGDSGNFMNVEVLDGEGNNIDGTFGISNGYKTLEFTPTDACGQDPCGDTIYCLPGNDAISVSAHSATLIGDGTSQAQAVGVSFDGLVDAAANSLDGNADDVAVGPPEDDYTDLSFTTTDDVEDTVPVITDMSAGISQSFVDQDADIDVTFSVAMRSSTLNTSNVSLWPDPWYEFWFTAGKTDVLDVDGDTEYTVANIGHPVMVSADDEGWFYDPVVTRGVKSAYQICMFPAYGPSAYDESDTTCSGDAEGSDGVSSGESYCCNGAPSDSACLTTQADEGGSFYDLPDSSE